MSPVGQKSVPCDADLFRAWCRRFGYVPIQEEIGALLGLTTKHVANKINKRGFLDKEKIILAKEFELTAQEFVDLFFPNCFRPDGNIKLDREVKYLGVKERGFDIFPMSSI